MNVINHKVRVRVKVTKFKNKFIKGWKIDSQKKRRHPVVHNRFLLTCFRAFGFRCIEFLQNHRKSSDTTNKNQQSTKQVNQNGYVPLNVVVFLRIDLLPFNKLVLEFYNFDPNPNLMIDDIHIRINKLRKNDVYKKTTTLIECIILLKVA